MECLRAAPAMEAEPAEKHRRDERDPGEICPRGLTLPSCDVSQQSHVHPQESAYHRQFARLLLLRARGEVWLAWGGACRRFRPEKLFHPQLVRIFQDAAQPRR